FSETRAVAHEPRPPRPLLDAADNVARRQSIEGLRFPGHRQREKRLEIAPPSQRREEGRPEPKCNLEASLLKQGSRAHWMRTTPSCCNSVARAARSSRSWSALTSKDSSMP